LPYLRSVESKGEEVAPRYKSNVSIEKSDFVSKINGTYNQAGLNVNKLTKQIKIISHTEGGSVKELKLGGVVISGKKLRELLGLNSANFTIDITNKTIEIKCVGFGHGVGMSQWGANAMANEGESYIDILKHYYTGIEIYKINN